MVGIKLKVSQELFQDQAQLKNVAADGQGLAGVMFGRCDRRRHGNGWISNPVLVEQLGNAKIQQLDRTVFQNHDMLGFDVTMENEPVMRGLQRIRRFRNQHEPGRQG